MLAAIENKSLSMARTVQYILALIVVAISLLACSDIIKRHKYESLIEHNRDLFDQANAILNSKSNGVRYFRSVKIAYT